MTTIDEFTVKLTSDDWCTPADLAADLGWFDLDPCSNDRSHILSRRKIALPQDGLLAQWRRGESLFVNPPYSNVTPWANRLMTHDGPWVALVKLDPTTGWWRRFFNVPANVPTWAAFSKRLKFERPDKPPLTANFPCALIWRDWCPPEAINKRLTIGNYYG